MLLCKTAKNEKQHRLTIFVSKRTVLLRCIDTKTDSISRSTCSTPKKCMSRRGTCDWKRKLRRNVERTPCISGPPG